MGAPRFTAQEFVDLLKLWQIKYHVNPGWSTHNHNDQQSPLDLEFLVVHHTGDDAPDDADLRVLWNGRPDLPGPLCTGGIRDDGTLELISWGTSYHAGSGAANVLNAVRAGYVGSPPSPGPDMINGNRISLGWETMYSGRSAPRAEALATLIKVNAAICWKLGWPASRVIGHREWTRRKIDPGNLSMNQLRTTIRALIVAGPPAPIAPPTATGDEKDVSTFVGYIKGTTDSGQPVTRYYLFGGFWKRYIERPAALDELQERWGPAVEVTPVEADVYPDFDAYFGVLTNAAAGIATAVEQGRATAAAVDALAHPPV